MVCSRYLFSIWNWCVRKIYWRVTNNNLDELSDHEPDDTDRLVQPVFDTDRLVQPVFDTDRLVPPVFDTDRLVPPVFDKQVIIELLYEYDD